MRHGLLAILIAIASHGAVVAQPAGIQRMAWLQACWEVVSPERTVEEQWMAPRTQQGKVRRIEFPYRRAVCPGT